jgi:tripartite-type tricarboxylate transporter receptor subunit TctC
MMGNFSPLGFVQIATASPFIKAGKLIAFASTGASRDPQLPDVPTVAELGMPQLTTSVWFGLSGPRNLPAAITQRLTQAHEQMTASPKFKVHMAAAGLNATPGICGGAFQKKIENETQRWARIIKATGFSAVE